MKSGNKMENTILIKGKQVGHGYFQAEDGSLYLPVDPSDGLPDGILYNIDEGDLYIIAERDAETEQVTAIKQWI